MVSGGRRDLWRVGRLVRAAIVLEIDISVNCIAAIEQAA